MKQRRILFTFFTALSIIGYGSFVFAVTGPFAPGVELDPGCSYTDPDCTVDLSLTGVSIGSPVVSGAPNQILYTDADGKVFGDSVFTRDSTTGNTNILALFTGDLAGGFSIDTAAQNINAGVLDLVTNESALFEGLVSGGGMRTQMTYRKPSTNVLGQFVLQESGNSLTLDADTTDGVTASLIQSDDIFGLGIKGAVNIYQDTNTNQKAFSIVGDGTSVGVPGYFVISEVADTTGQLHAKQVLVADDAAGINTTYYNDATDTSVLQVFNGSGSSLTWDADTTDDITTSLIQSENALGFGAAGTWSAWQDTSTDLVSATGAGDLTSFGQGPGSTAMLSLNTATNDRATMTTQYDSGGATFQASNLVVNGVAEAGFSQNKLGNMLIWDADNTDTILTTFEQGQNLQGLGNIGNMLDYQSPGNGLGVTLLLGDLTATGGEANAFFVQSSDGINNSSIMVDVANGIVFNQNYAFPMNDGTTDYLLATDGAGQLFWQDPSLIPSDSSLKSNINSLSYGLDTLMQLNPVSYTMNSTGKDQIGFIAQEVESLVPELVGEVANGKKGLAYGQMTAVIVKSVQELNLKITDIENFASAENKTFLNNLIAWLGDVGNGVEKLFAKEVHTDTLCVGETCVTESQLQELLQGQSITSGGSSADDSSELESESDADISGNDENETDSVDDTLSDPLPELESNPEPVSDPGLVPDSGEVSETI